MKAKLIKSEMGCVHGRSVVRIEAQRAEIKALEEALDVVARFKSRAMATARATDGADWTMVSYVFARGKESVDVVVEQGSCG
jgi:predicted fused transcriptional regulator/phosphomethylpyrimidine kinase